MKKFYFKYYIKIVKHLRSVGILKNPKRSYTYNGETFPFYYAPSYGTSSGKLYIKDAELFKSVKFRKILDKARKIKIMPK